MKERMILVRIIFLTAVFGIALAGCASMEKTYALNTEELLAAAKFKKKVADTPEKLAHLQSLTQLKMVAHERDGKTYYVFADAAYCKCLYAGNQKEYARYQDLSDEQTDAEMNANAPMAWGMWGPWGSGW